LLLQYVCHSVDCHWPYTGFYWLFLSQLNMRKYRALHWLQIPEIRV
jgi:hypothetical protein